MVQVISVTKPINLNQLSYELRQAMGGPPLPLRYVEGARVICEEDSIDVLAFHTVIAAHQADPDWQPPAVELPRPGLLRRLLRRSG